MVNSNETICLQSFTFNRHKGCVWVVNKILRRPPRSILVSSSCKVGAIHTGH